MLYADDLVIVRRTLEELIRAFQVWQDTFQRCRLKINIRKTEFMTTGQHIGNLQVGEQQIQQVKEFKYLGTVVSSDASVSREVVHRQQRAWAAWKGVTGVLSDRKITKELKSEVYKRVIRPSMTYGSECLTTKKSDSDKLAVTEMNILRRIDGVTRQDRKRNENIRRDLKVEQINEYLRTNRLRWFGHVYRRPEEDVLKRMYLYEADGQRRRGRPKTTWKRLVEGDMTERHLRRRMALDRDQWRRHLRDTPNRDSSPTR